MSTTQRAQQPSLNSPQDSTTTKEPQADPKSAYFDQLANKVPGNDKANEYVAIKNVSVQEQLQSGKQLISKETSNIQKDAKREGPPSNAAKLIIENQQQKQRIEQKLSQINQSLSNGKSAQLNNKPVMTDEERKRFIQQKKKESIQLEKKRREQLRKKEEKQKQEEDKRQNELNKRLQEARVKKHQEAKQKLEMIQKRKQVRIEEYKKNQEVYKSKSKEKTLLNKIEERFKSSQNMLLQEKKKRLAELRQLHKPISKAELDEHSKNFEQSLIERSRKKDDRPSQSQMSQLSNQYYRSMFHERLEKEEEEKKRRDSDLKENLKQLKQRSKKYAEELKSRCPPEIDLKKRQEIQKRIKSSSVLDSRNEMAAKFKGLEYLSFTKQYGVSHKRPQDQGPKTSEKLLSAHPKQINYLQSMRNNSEKDSRIRRSVTSAQDFIKSVEKKNISASQKQQKIIQYAEGLERKAKEKQRMLRSSEEVDEDLDKLYVCAIEAKLKALEQEAR